ncbi:MAG: beta-ketoacyl synthase N-terminal-like domain-containing protein [Chthoniobacterales bacterium]
MILRICGMGWITPLGGGVDPVWQRLLRGDEAQPEQIKDQFNERSYCVFRVPDSALKALPPHPRLRRASAISRFAAAAGLEALNDAGIGIDSERAKRTALVFAISNGGVIYTKRFYRDIVESGAQSASPLLFPETVFNAPASHLAAILGITGATYTLVGDGAVGALAVRMAEDLMRSSEFDYCLVVGAEEADWLLCDAYRKWRLARSQPPVEAFGQRPRGTIVSEGAGAILLAREGLVGIDKTDPGGYYANRAALERVARQTVSNLADAKIDIVISSANGTFVDAAESAAIAQHCGDALVYTAKPALGESVGASGLWQIIIGVKTLLTEELPPLLHYKSAPSLHVSQSRTKLSAARRVLALTCGLNQQVAGVRLRATAKRASTFSSR